MINWGFIGASRIAEKITPLIQVTEDQKILAIASRSPEKAKSFSVKFNVPNYYSNYEDLISNEKINAVYISLPNSSHFDWCKRALIAGKNVLCEKPLAMNSHQVIELTALAQENRVHLAEGFMYRYHNQTRSIIKLIQSKNYGKVLFLHGTFNFQLSDTNNIRLRYEEGGGALRDIGCYIVDFIHALIENPLKKLHVISEFASTGVDSSNSVMLEYSEGITATFNCSFKAPRRDYYEIICENGQFLIDSPFKPDRSTGVKILTPENTTHQTWPDPLDPYFKQFENFRKVIEFKEAPIVTLEQSLRNQNVLDLIAIEHLQQKNKN